MSLRPYQSAAIESALCALTKSGSAVLQMPTGAGKTKTATEIVRSHDKPVWFVCHRQEIERQASTAFAAAGIDHGIVSPRGEPEYDKPVQIVSVATLANRMDELPDPSLVIWDECHHVAADSWSRIREALPDALHLGLTATPERLDGKGLDDWFDELIVGPSIQDLIDGGWLSPFRYFAPSEPDLTKARVGAKGDYTKGALDKALNIPVLIGDAVAEYLAKANGKRALVFCASVEASEELVARFNESGVPAAHIDGNTPDDMRVSVVESLACGELKVISNVEVFTEGVDIPSIDAVILLRPTKSLALFLQMIGRVLRRAEGKDEALIFDHAGLWLEHGLPNTRTDWSLEGGARKRRLASVGEGRLRRCPECKEVRVERAEVCACGFEFPTGREIGEYDGQLYELRGAVPEGCVTQAEFARMSGFSQSSVGKWVSRGMPNNHGFPILKDGLEWVRINVRSVPDGHETQSAFARRHGVSSGTITDWIRRGLPVSDDRSIEIVTGDLWVQDNVARRPKGHESQTEFARRFGVDSSRVRSWIRCGMPYSKLGGVPVAKAISWVDDFLCRGNVPDGCETKRVFASRFGKSQAAVHHWIAKGLPNVEGFPLIEEGAAWVSRNVTMPPTDQAETKADFSRRVGVRDQGTITGWLKKGMPRDKHGHPHIQKALEWVRDNTSIPIPPEAWPSANDNQEPKEEAA